ncbi:MAG: hypothetical protein HND43_11215 [Armatimonadetes bacterium]|nr:hypothetical protein [Armatimonadota bacterium]
MEGFNLSWQWTDKTHTSGFYDENQSQNLPTTRYYYDGQMAVEDDNTVVSQNEPVVTVMRYGIGARDRFSGEICRRRGGNEGISVV